jgi:hypothetical protein
MTKYEWMVDELQQRVNMLHVLAGIEVTDEARGFALGMMQASLAGLDHAAETSYRRSRRGRSPPSSGCDCVSAGDERLWSGGGV